MIAIDSRLYVFGEVRFNGVLITYDLDDFPNSVSDIHVQDFPKFLIRGPNPTRDGEMVSVANNGRVSITDISDRDKPRVAASFESPCQAATLMDKRLYLSDARDLWIYSISKP
jgi:hypothetical protein